SQLNKVARLPAAIAGATRRLRGHRISTQPRAARPQLDWLTLVPSAPPSQALRRYQSAQRSLLGRWRFARAVRLRTPLLATLQAQFGELRVGLCRIEMQAHRRV